MWRLANHCAGHPAFLPLGLAVVWNWRGTIGKVTGPNGERQNEKGVIPNFERIAWAGRRVIIAFDADIVAKDNVRAARAALSKELRRRGAQVGFLEWDEAAGKGVDDWSAAAGPDEVLAAIAAIDFDGSNVWQSGLARDNRGNVRADPRNAAFALRESPEWRGVLAHDDFAIRIEARQPTPWGFTGEWTDTADLKLCVWLQEHGIGVRADIAAQAVEVVAFESRYHPVRDYLNGLKWDGVLRLDSWLTDYLGAGKSSVAADDKGRYKPANYTSAVGACRMISAVARVMEPGCKVDHEGRRAHMGRRDEGMPDGRGRIVIGVIEIDRAAPVHA